VRGGGKPFRGGAVFGPAVPGGARQATDGEMALIRERAAATRRRHEEAVTRARQRWWGEAMTCARHLLEKGTGRMLTDDGEVAGRLVRFWRGDAVLELRGTRTDGRPAGSSMARLSRGHETPDAVATYLINQVVLLSG